MPMLLQTYAHMLHNQIISQVLEEMAYKIPLAKKKKQN